MTTTASAPTSAAWAASATVSAVVCAPHCTATWSRLSAACRKRSATTAPLALLEKDPLARRAEREDPVEPRVDEEVDEQARTRPRRARAGVRGAASPTRQGRRAAAISGALALAHAFDRARDPPGARLRTLRFLDPLDVLAAMRERHAGECARSPPDRRRAPRAGRPGRRTVRGSVSNSISTRTRSPASTPVAALRRGSRRRGRRRRTRRESSATCGRGS